MKRRDFSFQLAGAGLGLALTGAARAQGAPVEGQQYVKLQTAAPVALPSPDKKIEVVEFFWYGCPHCYAFEPVLEPWVKRLPADVYFHQLPVGFAAPHQLHQRLFFALEESGQLPALHRKVFDAIHLQSKRLNTESDLEAFVAASGGDVAKFAAAMKSFSVNTKATRARQLSEAYKIDGVPAIGIQGRFFTSPALQGDRDAKRAMQTALQTTDFLIQLARQSA